MIDKCFLRCNFFANTHTYTYNHMLAHAARIDDVTTWKDEGFEIFQERKKPNCSTQYFIRANFKSSRSSSFVVSRHTQTNFFCVIYRLIPSLITETYFYGKHIIFIVSFLLSFQKVTMATHLEEPSYSWNFFVWFFFFNGIISIWNFFLQSSSPTRYWRKREEGRMHKNKNIRY